MAVHISGALLRFVCGLVNGKLASPRMRINGLKERKDLQGLLWFIRRKWLGRRLMTEDKRRGRAGAGF